jgi:hypothetical protein
MSVVQSGNGGGLSWTDPGRTPFVIPDRTLVSRGSKVGAVQPFHLEEVRDYLKKLEVNQSPQDYDRSLDNLHVDFEEGHMKGRFLMHDGISREVFLVSNNGAHQLASHVLPSGKFFSGLRELAVKDSQAEKLATMVWAKFKEEKEKGMVVRTVNMRVNGSVRRVIRACLTPSYAAYSNLEFAQALLDHSEHFAEMPVLDWKVTDSGMRIRFCAIDEPLAVLRHWDEGALLHEPVPMIEGWNSEVGRRRVGFRGGMWKLVCTNGMGHWDKKREFSWIHRGDAKRIREGVRHGYEDIMTTANGVVDAYNKALEVSIDDAYLWMQAELKRAGATKKVIAAAETNLSDPSTTPGGLLASVVDSITLTAQGESDIFSQYDVENLAANVLRRGLSQSLTSPSKSIKASK